MYSSFQTIYKMNMKRVLLFLVACFLMSGQVTAMEEIDFTVGKIDPNPIGHDVPRGPIEIPTVFIENYTLLFTSGHAEYAMSIKDEYGCVVYTNIVGSNETTIILPSMLSGTYELCLYAGGYCFSGEIEL